MSVTASEQRRLRLRVLTKLMLAVAFFTVAYVFLSAFLSGDKSAGAMPSLPVAVGDMQPGDVQRLTWQGRPVLIHRRGPAEMAALASANGRLQDPDSSDSDQPDWARNPERSREPGWFVAIAVGTDMSCPIDWLPASSEVFQGQPWLGGFVDQCRGSRYDVAGRVYAGQYADQNLIVPYWSLQEPVLTLGGG